MSKTARQIAVDKFSLSGLTRRYEELYDAIIEKKS